MELGHLDEGAEVTSDSMPNANRVKTLLIELCATLGQVSTAKQIIFGAIHTLTRDLYQAIITDIPESRKKLWKTLDLGCVFCSRHVS